MLWNMQIDFQGVHKGVYFSFILSILTWQPLATRSNQNYLIFFPYVLSFEHFSFVKLNLFPV